MKKNNHNFAVMMATGALVLAVAAPAFAQVGSRLGAAGASGSAEAAAMTRAVQRGDQEITRRIDILNAVNTRAGAMVRVSSDEKTAISTSIQNQIAALNQLEAQLSTDAGNNATSAVATDVKSITSSYRIFILVVPQTDIAIAADRIETTVSMLQGIGTKVEARLSGAQASGTDVTAIQTLYSDYTAKLADAQAQAQAAVSETASLTPDNGNQTQMQSNSAALRDARSKIGTAQKDLIAVRQDAATIIKDLANIAAQ